MIRFLGSFFKESVRAIAIPAALFSLLAVAFAFTEPSVAPPGGIVNPPINTSGTAQTKTGSFTSSGTLTGNILNATSQVCIAGDCRLVWPSGGGGITSINSQTGPAITLSAGSGVTISTPFANNIQISSTGTGGIGGSGTLNKVPKFTPDGTTLGDSQIFDNGANIGIGTSNPSGKFQVVNGSDSTTFFNVTPNGIIGLGIQHGSYITQLGYLGSDYGFGVSDLLGNLRVALSTNVSLGGVSLGAYNNGDLSFITLGNTGNNIRMFIRNSDGNVGIGTTNPSQKLDVAGNLNVSGQIFAGVKDFKIDDPLDPEHKYLFHSTLEGPEHGVYYRGEGQLQGGRAEITLPAYFEALTRKDGRTASLTNIDGGDMLWVETQDGSQVKDGKFVVRSSNVNSLQKFNWEVKAVRADVAPLQVEMPKESR